MFAGIMLLAHMLIPHHYHYSSLCVEIGQCTDDLVPHQAHSGADDSHERHDCQHHGHHSETCVINEIVPASLENRYKFTSLVKTVDKQFSDHDAFNAYTGYAKLIGKRLLIESHFFDFILPHNSVVLYPNGLRAPPSC